MNLKYLVVLGSVLLITGCIVPQSRVDDALAKCRAMESDVRSKDQELTKNSKKIQELEGSNRALATDLIKSKMEIVEKEKELRENQALIDALLKQIKTGH